MRRGYDACLLFSKSGNLIAFGTGSDACTEHECGSKPMMDRLCTQGARDADTVRELKRRIDGKKTMVERLFGMKDMVYPDLLESKRIVLHPESLRFIKVDGDTPEAYLALASHDVTKDRELDFPTYEKSDCNVAGAWDDHTFALRVRGKKYVKALEEFYADLQLNKVVFAGTFLKNDKLRGVIIANTRYFGEEIKANIKEAQASHESGLRLKAVDDTRDVLNEMREASGVKLDPGYLWVRWETNEENNIVYCLNPGYRVNADYYGPYTRQQLLDWAKTGYQTKLTNRESA